MQLSPKLIACALALGCATAIQATAEQIHGSGSTFVYPIMASWTETYAKASGVDIAYQPIGSSGGNHGNKGGDRRLWRIGRATAARRAQP